MSDLTEFLNARLDEDEAWARMAQDASDASPWRHGSGRFTADVFTAAGLLVAGSRSANTSRHIARHDPARVLADVQAKRAIVGEIVPAIAANDRAINGEWNDAHEDCAGDLLRTMAVVYSDHPDYRAEWRR